MTENEISAVIVDSAYKVHKTLGPGLLESAYEACLTYELNESGLTVQTQKALPVIYNGVTIDCGYRLDILVKNKVIVEIKAVEQLNRTHFAQILTYLKLYNSHLGLLINFNVPMIKDGIKRIVNNLHEV